ncbi:MAG: hypothetical protein LBC09_06190, partial [Helicobacteraceae bacterium]|nr:hypothetical protein [Helicobacteraceae bacterium]
CSTAAKFPKPQKAALHAAKMPQNKAKRQMMELRGTNKERDDREIAINALSNKLEQAKYLDQKEMLETRLLLGQLELSRYLDDSEIAEVNALSIKLRSAVERLWLEDVTSARAKGTIISGKRNITVESDPVTARVEIFEDGVTRCVLIEIP